MYSNNRIPMYDDANYDVYYYSIALLFKTPLTKYLNYKHRPD
jgi:hypothetical protein